MSKPRSAAHEPPPADRISWVRTAIALLLTAAGLGYALYYAFWVFDDGSPARIAELAGWNWVIGFGVMFLGMILAASPSTPMGRGRGVLVGMLGSFLIGLFWIVLYYFTSASGGVPLVEQLGNYNLLVGIGFMAVGFVYATKWE